jgi:hypothetical protein
MPYIDVVLVLAVLACLWVCSSARNLAQAATLRNHFKLLAALATGVLLAIAPLSTEWIINSVAGEQVAPPTTPFTPAKVANSPAPVMVAHSIGMVETAVERNRVSAASMLVALLASLCVGYIAGRRGRAQALRVSPSEHVRSAA